MIDKILVSDINLEPILSSIINDLITKIKNKDISLPYTNQLSKSSYLKVDGNGNMFLNNNGQYIELGFINNDKLDIDKVYKIFNIHTILGDIWSTNYSNMPTIRYDFGCVEYNGKIYCIGGFNSNNYLNKVEVYDILSNTWSTNYNNMPTSRYGFGCIEYNGKIYCIGGINTGFLNIVEVYDIASNTWSTNYNNMPTSRFDFGCVEYNGKIYCIGGYNGVVTLEVYDILSNTWSTNYNNMPTSRYGLGSIEYKGKIYCIGGYGNGFLNKVEVYDILSNTWSTNYNNMPTSRNAFGCIEYNGKIYCIGGNSQTNKVEVYDIASNTWSTNYNNMPTSISEFGCIEYNNKIYCIGAPKVEVYTIDSHPSYNITIPDELYSKLNEIITNGDGTKILHNNGKYTSITPTYNVMSSTQVSEMMNRLILD